MRSLPLICLLSIGCAQKSEQSSVPAPSAVLSVFEAGTVSDGFDNRDLAISAGGDELYFTLQHENRISIVMHAKRQRNGWTVPQPASFSGKYKDLEPAFSPDGERLYFASNRPLTDSGVTADFNIWYIQRSNGSWSKPEPLDSNINSGKDEYYPSLNRQNDLYFTRDNGEKKEDIFIARFTNGRYLPAQPLPEAVNGPGYEFNAFVDPDNRFLIFTSYGRADDLGGGDLYISYYKNSSWQSAIHLNPPVNSSSIDYCPYISPDGRFFYFTSSRMNPNFLDSAGIDREKLWKALSSPGNGSDDIYRIVSDSVIQLK
jgi:Tol biopolymer transport system component